MTDIRDIPQLEILPVDKLVLHEYHDPQRSPGLARALESSGILRNPPVVVPLKDGSGRYMVVDGANRMTSVKSLGIAHIVAQVVMADYPGLSLFSWNHVIWGISPDELLDRFMGIPDLVLKPTDGERAFRTLMDIHSIAVICLPNQQAFDLRTPRLLFAHHIELLNSVVRCYQDDAYLDRTQARDVESLRPFYPHLSGLLILPPFRVDQLLHVVESGNLMPPGSTRFTISPRVLYLNYPLKKLASSHTLEEKNQELQLLLQERLSRKKVRYYEEATFLFDE